MAELQADETLINGLATLSETPYEALGQALQKAVVDKVLLYARLENEAGAHELYFLNSEGGRMMLEKMWLTTS